MVHNRMIEPTAQRRAEAEAAVPAPVPNIDYSAVTKFVIDAWETAMASLSEPTAPCPRCNGRGYHHGFGEDGNDPDWCVQCGGPGYVCAYDDKEISDGALYAASMALEYALSGDGDAKLSSTANPNAPSDMNQNSPPDLLEKAGT